MAMNVAFHAFITLSGPHECLQLATTTTGYLDFGGGHHSQGGRHSSVLLLAIGKGMSQIPHQ